MGVQPVLCHFVADKKENAGAGAQVGSAGPEGERGVMRAFTLLRHV